MFKTFGKLPTGAHLERIQKSPNYRDGAFQNIHPTAIQAENASILKMLREFAFKPKDVTPDRPLPHARTDLKALPDAEPVLVWFGHSSYLIKYEGRALLVDPVFSGHASPFPSMIKAFPGTDAYGVDDLPETIDTLLLTHDHYDHIDYETLERLKHRALQVIAPLGASSHLLHWGWDEKRITELDWWESTRALGGFGVTATPARHFSGRLFGRAQTLWASYVLDLGTHRLFLGGDSGYDDQFMAIGEKYGPFDLALLECGQYGKDWPYIHMFPEQSAQAAKDLQAKALLPVHWAKFVLSLHPWSDSIRRVEAAAASLGLPLTTPKIGEPVIIGRPYPTQKWWLF